ncbi:hypothetical protein NS96R_18360 [Pseudomonas parafulva]|uniref:Uncharacterized protein n=1 Tax=Pseudomonas parafulva TaxID=157782 RepID=A0AAJ0LH62_9PSED|nr:hypothetical protein NS96R_18360 [Pseudomonas parafulva]
MANSHSTHSLPLDALDELHHLNGALAAFDELMAAWLAQTMTEGAFGDPQNFPCGVQYLLRPVIEGYRRITDIANGRVPGEPVSPGSTLP